MLMMKTWSTLLFVCCMHTCVSVPNLWTQRSTTDAFTAGVIGSCDLPDIRLGTDPGPL